jgi:signal transduction histidine kinase/ActR/RegA family two-component response regulator
VKLRNHVLLLVLVTVVPMVLFAAALIFYNARLQHQAAERGMRDTARALALALDREIHDLTTGVKTLAASRHLDAPVDLRRFYEEAATVSKSFGGWAVLSDPSGRQLFNTLRPFGAELPVPSEKSLEMMRAVAARREPFVSNLLIGAVSRRPAAILAVPVVRGGEVRYILDFPLEPSAFTRLLREAALSPGWIATITDREGVVVAWVPDTANHVGRRLPTPWLERVTGSAEGFLAGTEFSGESVYAAYQRSRESGWMVAVAAPASVVEAPFRRSLLALSAGGALLLVAAFALAYVLSSRITGPIVALADSLKRAPERTPAAPRAAEVEEVEQLRRALEEATHHKIAGEALREANRRKDEFLAMVSHELRNPLNAMLGWLRLLRGGTLDAPATRRALDVIERSVNQQSRLIADLLDVSRIVAGKLTLRMQLVELPALVGGVVESARPGFDAKAVTLSSSVAPDAGPVHGDPERLRQVVENLLSNALKFTPEGGIVSIALSHAEVGVRLTVMDTGAGIRADLLPHVFERFRQGDSTSTKQAGLGLGLAIVRFVVEAHGGRVRAQSAGPGKGATFAVELPLARATAGERTAVADVTAAVAVSAQSLDGVTVLIADDDADTREVLAAIVAQHGGAPTTVGSGTSDALAAIARRRPHVLVCDLAVPGDDHFALIRALRARPAAHGGTTPALAVTSDVQLEGGEAVLAAGFQSHLAKPVEPEALVRAIARLARSATRA